MKQALGDLKQGVPTGKTGPALNRGLEPVEDARHRLRGPSRYEWWYFDASLDNGYSAVCILWPMNYFKPWKRQCAIMLSIYSPKGNTSSIMYSHLAISFRLPMISAM